MSADTKAVLNRLLARCSDELLAMSHGCPLHAKDIHRTVYHGSNGDPLRRVIAIGWELEIGGPGIMLMTAAVAAVGDRGVGDDYVELMRAWDGIGGFVDLNNYTI